jgi:hypothetical protein
MEELISKFSHEKFLKGSIVIIVYIVDKMETECKETGFRKKYALVIPEEEGT